MPRRRRSSPADAAHAFLRLSPRRQLATAGIVLAIFLVAGVIYYISSRKPITTTTVELPSSRPAVVQTRPANKNTAHPPIDHLLLGKGQFAQKLPTAPALQVLHKRSRTIVFQKDLTDARRAWLSAAPTPQERAKRAATDFLLYCDRTGKFADFHSFRHATSSFLVQSGVTPKVAQAIMRHSDINLTMSTYAHAYRQDEVKAVEGLPDLGQRPQRKRQAETG